MSGLGTALAHASARTTLRINIRNPQPWGAGFIPRGTSAPLLSKSMDCRGVFSQSVLERTSVRPCGQVLLRRNDSNSLCRVSPGIRPKRVVRSRDTERCTQRDHGVR